MLALRNSLFDEFFAPFQNEAVRQNRWTWSCFSPATDVRESEDAYSIELDIPGLTEKEIELTLENRHLTLRGERKALENANYTRQERAFGSFERVFRLPEDADTAQITARARNGVLTVEIPKKEQAKARTISVSAE